MNKAVAVALVFFGWLAVTQVQAAARKLTSSDALAIIDRVNAQEFGGWFDPLDVLAVARIESDLDPDAYRAEPQINDASIGLMQVLYSTARDRGFAQGPAALFDPVANVTMGMRQLRWIWDYIAARRGGQVSEDEWIGAYNVGVGNVIKGNVPASYVARWREARGALNG